ncbi:unnamed protein product [Polarella glacialis]|uniref:HMG box domain-containing protein n=2 Tax=Polarella glacialis TaxID=89957 RepID=A0A813DZA0_POLGL|nr:unnamed protein product [Polarella glacialis]
MKSNATHTFRLAKYQLAKKLGQSQSPSTPNLNVRFACNSIHTIRYSRASPPTENSKRPMAPKRKQTKSKKRSANTSAKSSRKSSSAGPRARSAYIYFSTSQRKAVLQKRGIDDKPANFVDAARALAAAWKDMDEVDRAPFEDCAAIDRSRRDVDCLRGAALTGSNEVGTAVKGAVDGLARAPPASSFSCATTAAEGLIEALERLDARLGPGGRAAAAEGIRRIGSSSTVVSSAAAVLGARLTGRLSELLKRWATAPPARPSAARPARAAPATATTGAPPRSSHAATGDLDDETRSRVVGMLMRTSARGAGKASFQKCREVEQALFRKFGSDSKEYRRRARSLNYNLGATDGALLQRVLEGTLDAAQLVVLQAEELAPEALKAQRQEERERYFKSEVQLTAGPQKRRRGANGGRAAERAVGDVEATQESSQPTAASQEPIEHDDAARDVVVGETESAAASAADRSSSSDEDSDDDDSSQSDSDAKRPARVGQVPLAAQEAAAGEDTSSDAALARLLEMASPSSSSSSSSSSPSNSPSRTSVATPASSSSSSAPSVQIGSLQRILDMGFSSEPGAQKLTWRMS